MQQNDTIRQINAYAMQNGIVLGLYGVGSMAVFKWSLSVPFFSTLFMVMLLGGPVLCIVQTMRMRNETVGKTGEFGFFKGFIHAFFCGGYASIWVALATFIYLQYFDHGSIFAAYADSLNTPEMKLYLEQTGLDSQVREMTGIGGVGGIAEAAKQVGAATYAAMSLYFAMILGPFIAAFVGLVCRRSK